MKKLISFFILVFLIAGCNQRNDKVEVIRLDNSDYISRGLDDPGNVNQANYNPEIVSKISARLKDSDLQNNGFENYDFDLYINKSGRPDKIVVLNAPDDKTADIIIDVLSHETFGKATKDGNPVKYKFDWRYTMGYNVMADQMPEPIGGITAIQKNIVYPEIARRAGIQGKVYVTAFINKSGDVVKAIIIKGIGGGCDQAAISAIKKVKFVPGMQKGVPVKVQVSIPVIFKLSDK